ncbi:MAG: hypothetical protein IPN15_05405 [Saprospiraceae bacterium]|nr:hypothetical protein [Candidatus Vicinibacter affinis]
MLCRNGFWRETENIRKAIKQAISGTGFDPIIIDEKNISSDNTINDAIISNIRVANFVLQILHYIEMEYILKVDLLLGLGKPVIYLCRKNEFEKAHFDIKPLQHIIYETEKELTRKLTDKINAWII